MGNVLTFPSQQVQGLAYLDRQLRDLMAAKGADEVVIDFAVGQLTSIYTQLSQSEQYTFDVTLPAHLSEQECDSLSQQINRGLEGIRKENHALLVRLVAQLVLAEVKLFQHERES
jgi:hypothetical protein